MTDYTDLHKAAEYAAQDTIKFADESEEMRALQQFHEEVDPETVLALIAENNALNGPHDWLAEDLIKELVDNAQAYQENSDHGENDPFAIVLLAAASRIRRQEAGIEKLKADFEFSAKTADCWDRLNVHNKALSDSFRAERDQLKAAISTPELVFINMKSGRIAKISLRSAIDLHGEVINGDDAQQIEIAKLRAEVAGLKTGYEAYERVNAELKAEVEELRKERDARHPFKPFHEPSIGYTGCVICGVYTDHGGLPCPKTRATAYAALGEGEQS